MNHGNKQAGAAFIVLAGIFWGTMGLFVRSLGGYGFDSFQISAFRLLSASLCFLLVLFLRDRKGLRICLRDVPLFLGMGFGSIAVMTCCYFSAIRMLSMSAAAILLYTSPIWVMLMSALFFRERITRRKCLALVLAFGGCVLVSGLGGGVKAAGLAVGIASGVAYGLYSILGSIALRRYSPFTVTAYAFSIAALGVFIIADPADMAVKFVAAHKPMHLVLLVLATGIITAVIPYLIYTMGLQWVEPSRAAILATSEPMAAALLGMLVYRENIKLSSAAGILCILLAIILLNAGKAGAEGQNM